jgi:crossover junction endodeoxyribonuclease RuvC
LTVILGIDPGLSGALAFYNPETGFLSVLDMPTLKAGGTKGKSVIDMASLARLIDAESTRISQCYLELVGTRPGESGVGAFSFGEGVGIIRGILAASFIPVTRVTPAVWKKAMGCTGDKEQSRARASEILPRHADKWPLKKHDGRAEAAVLAVYGARQLALQTISAA